MSWCYLDANLLPDCPDHSGVTEVVTIDGSRRGSGRLRHRRRHHAAGVVGTRLPGSQGPAAAAGLSALLYVPVGIWALASHPVTVAALGRAATAGLGRAAVPMVADLLALRRVPAGFFGVFMGVNPVFAALTGLVVLGQSLGPASWLAAATIVTANVASLSAAGRRGRRKRLGAAAARRGTGTVRPGVQQPSYGAQGEAPASAYSLANAARCTLTGAVWAPPG